MDFDKPMQPSQEFEMERRRNPMKTECLKLDTFASINQSLQKIEAKIDDLSEEMRTMIKLETQVIQQNKDIERLNITVDNLVAKNQELSQRLLELRSNFESQKQSIGTVERIIWAAATCVAIVIGKYLGLS